MNFGWVLITGQPWNVSVPESISTTVGSDVTIPCTFTYPKMYHTDNVQVYWKKKVRSSFNTYDKDRNAFIYHPNSTFVLENYKTKTEITGDKAKGNCSMMIFNISDSDKDIYVRIIAKGDNYSFLKNPVSIFVKGKNFAF